MTILYINDTFLEATEAKISPFDRSYLFGEGVFETLRSFKGVFPLLENHLARLEWSSSFLGFDYPGQANFKKILKELLEKNDLEDARFKILLSQSPKNLNACSCSPRGRDDDGYKTNVTIFCEPLTSVPSEQPCKLKIIKNYVNDSLPLAAMKTTNYLAKLRGKFEALDAGFDDGVLLNSQGNVTETCTANIFWVDKDAKLWTVLDEQGLLSGVMKKQLIDLLKEKEIHIQEGLITAKELSSAREIFITNSVIGIKPVMAIDDRQISGGDTGDITLMIMELWKGRIEEMVGE